MNRRMPGVWLNLWLDNSKVKKMNNERVKLKGEPFFEARNLKCKYADSEEHSCKRLLLTNTLMLDARS